MILIAKAIRPLLPHQTVLFHASQVQRTYPLHAEASQRAKVSFYSEEESLAAFLHSRPPPAGTLSAQAANASYRRWCAERVAAGELRVLSSMREAVLKWSETARSQRHMVDDDVKTHGDDAVEHLW